jgi:hypothetical protein
MEHVRAMRGALGVDVPVLDRYLGDEARVTGIVNAGN